MRWLALAVLALAAAVAMGRSSVALVLRDGPEDD